MTNFIVTPFFNQSDTRYFGFAHGDTLTRSELPELNCFDLALDTDSPEVVAEAVFSMLNKDNRPNRKVERSLSVGDVVMVEWLNTETTFIEQVRLACDHLGWRRV